MRAFLRSIVFAEEALNFSDDGPRLAWFGEISIAADFHRFLAIGRERVRSQRDDRNRLGRWIVLEHLGRLPAVDDGNRDIHQDQIGLFRSGLGYPFLAIESFSNL